MKSTYSSSYTGPQGHQSTIATYDNGNIDQITDKNGHVSHITGNIPGKNQFSYVSVCHTITVQFCKLNEAAAVSCHA